MQGDVDDSEDPNACVDESSISGPDAEDDLKSKCISVNSNSDALLAFVIEWEESASTTKGAPTKKTDVDPSVNEPIRRVVNVKPPKRFCRAFWSSVSRRILAHSNTQHIHPESSI